MTWKVEIGMQKKKYYYLCHEHTSDVHEFKQHNHAEARRPHHNGIGRR